MDVLPKLINDIIEGFESWSEVIKKFPKVGNWWLVKLLYFYIDYNLLLNLLILN